MRIVFSPHAVVQMELRGGTEAEVRSAIREGERQAARLGRTAFRKNFSYQAQWKGRYYETKQVMPVVVEENDTFVIVTVYVFYFGGEA